MQDREWIEIQRAAFGLKMDHNGRFWRDGEPFEHPRIVVFLRQHIECQQGAWIVRVQTQWVPLEVADLPLRVTSIELSDQAPELRVNLDDGRKAVPTELSSLRCDAQERLACAVPSASGESQLAARFSNHALMQIAEHLVGLDDNSPRWLSPDGQNIALPDFFEKR